MRSGESQRTPRWLTIAFYVGLLLLVAWLEFSSSSDGGAGAKFPAKVPSPDTAPTESSPSSQTATSEKQRADADREVGDQNRSLVVRNVRVIDEDGRVVYRGDVDLSRTLERIESGKRLRFSHDGIVFENRER